jgi:hypothetical protein
MNVKEVIGKTIHGYSFSIYVINDGDTNYEAQLTSTEIIQVRANSPEEVKEYFGDNLYQVTEIN